MADIKHETHIRYQSSKPRTTPYFLGCFGFSRKIPKKERSSEADRSDDAKKKARRFSWPRLCPKKSAAKTVPITSTVSEKPKVSPQIDPISKKLKPKSKSKSKSKKDNQLITVKTKVPTKHSHQPASEIEVVVAAATPDQPTDVKPLEIRYGPANKQSFLRRLQSSNDIIVSNKNNKAFQKRLSFCPKIETAGSVGKMIRSPEVKNSSKSNSEKLGAARSAPKKINRPATLENMGPTKTYDTVVAMSVIMVTLIILLLWGKLCAVLCTSAWFYFVPRLRSAIENDDVSVGRDPAPAPANPKAVDLNSDDYKKKVVLEGFLERPRRSPS